MGGLSGGFDPEVRRPEYNRDPLYGFKDYGNPEACNAVCSTSGIPKCYSRCMGIE